MKKILLIMAILLMTGCYDYNELNDLDIVASIIVDYNENKEGYEVHLEVLNTAESEEDGSHLVKGEGMTFEEALNDTFHDSYNVPFFSHLTTMVVSKAVAMDDMSVFYDYLLRDTDFRKDFQIYVTEDIDSILKYVPKKEESFGENSKKLTKTMIEKNGNYKTCSFREIVYHYLRNNTYMLGGISVEDEKVTIDNNYMMVDNKISMEVDEEAALFLNILYGKSEAFQLWKDNSYLFHDFKLEREIEKDKITLNFKGNVRLLNMYEKEDLDFENVKKLENDINQKIEELFNNIIEYSKKNDIDMFNFNYFYYLHYPKLAKEDSWKKLKYEIKSEVNVREKGMLLDTIEEGRDGK